MSIPESEQKKLFGRSGNRCAFPACRKLLATSAAIGGRIVVLGEAAHMVAESPNGPRGQSQLSLAERNRYENLLLLCSRHHQMVDAEPATYTVEVLLRYKTDHEKWIEQQLGPAPSEHPTLALVHDTVYSTLLPIESMPDAVFLGPCALSPQDITAHLGGLRGSEMAPYVLRAGMLVAFQNLTDLNNPFAAVVNPLEAQLVEPMSWWNDPDKSRWYIDLLNRTLNKLTGRRDLHWDRDHHRFFFPQSEPGAVREVTYRPLNQQSTVRQVVWQPLKRSTGEARPYWLHRGVSLRFVRTAERSWVLAMRPELRVTSDGITSIEPKWVGSRVTRKKARWFNYDLLGEVQFWRDYLGESKPRIILSFGSVAQRMVISTNLLMCQIDWPGIPSEHVREFKNVTYVDDLFTWAELEGEPEQDFAHLDEGEDETGELDEDF